MMQLYQAISMSIGRRIIKLCDETMIGPVVSVSSEVKILCEALSVLDNIIYAVRKDNDGEAE